MTPALWLLCWAACAACACSGAHAARNRYYRRNEAIRLRQASNPLSAWGQPFPEPPPSSVALCTLRGYACERLEVDTEDGYRLAVIHVVGKLNASRTTPRKRARRQARRGPILVQHGMIMSSDALLLRPDKDNLPLVLYDAGYDVWIGNFRGDGVSPNVHKTMSPSSFAFWNFSFHEMGKYDLPAMMDLVLERTGQPSLDYVGHSMGGTAALIQLSTRPEYNAKVRLAVLLAPAAYWSRTPSGIWQLLARFAPWIKKWLTRYKIWNVFPHSAVLSRLLETFCTRRTPMIQKTVCNSIVYEIAGRSEKHILPDLVPIVSPYIPAGVSLRTLEHYMELINSGVFRQLGKRGLGDPNPGPLYNISAITAPVAVFYANNDRFEYPSDSEHFASSLPNLVFKQLVPDQTFNHADFLFASDVRNLLYRKMLRVMRNVA